MKQIKAFIGHSFDSNDKTVVDTFIEYFNSLKKAMSFDWDHATEAEPKALSDKVKGKMESKNLFIGIFTKKDHRIPKEKMKEAFIGKKLCAEENDFKLGVSDWIVQESGYALGRGMRLLYLIEEGIGKLSGLHGDLEYVNFNRENPSWSYNKINEWIGNLHEEIKKEITDREQILTSSGAKEVQEDEKGSLIEEEKSDKKDPAFLKNVNNIISLRKLILKENDSLKVMNELDRILYECKNDTTCDEIYWRSIFYELKIEAGHSDSFEDLRQLADNNPTDNRPRRTLADCYKKYKTYDEAAKQFLLIANKEEDKDDRIDNIIEAAECFSKDNNFFEARNIILKEFTDGGYNTFQLSKLYKELAILAKDEGKNNHFISFAEKALVYSPSDSDLRFRLAYNSNNIGKNDLAFYHYKIHCEENPSGAAFNNIGILYDSFDMPGKSVVSYKTAIKSYNETLSVSNLANKYIKEGFYDDAKEILLKAKEQEDHHENVDSSLLNINTKIDIENKLEVNKAGSVNNERKFMINYAQAYTINMETNPEGEWEFRHGKITLSQEDDKVTGHDEVLPTPPQTPQSFKGLGLGNALLGLGIAGKIIDIEGIINNRAIEYSLTIKRTSPTAILSTTPITEYEGLMIISEDGNSIEVIERKKSEKEWEFYKMKKVGPINFIE